MKNVILIEGKKIDNFTISLTELIKKHENSEFDLQARIGQKVDIYNQIALIMCSSGTTGLPKGVLTTQANMMACLRTYRDALKYVKNFHKINIIAFNIAPWFHVLGFLSMYMYVSSHDSVYVYLKKFEEKAFFESVEVKFVFFFLNFILKFPFWQKYKVNFAIVVPPVMVMIAKSSLFDKYDLSSLKGKFVEIVSKN